MAVKLCVLTVSCLLTLCSITAHTPGFDAVPISPGMLYRAILKNNMTSEERRKARYDRRKASREQKRHEKLAHYDDYSLICDHDNLFRSFRLCKRGVSWKESTQRYEMNLFQNILDTKKRLVSGDDIQSGFVEFTLRERGKIRHIKSVHISERVVQKALCDEVLAPILTNSLIYDNGASLKGKGVHFAIRRLICHLSRFYRQNNFSNNGFAMTIDFKNFFWSIPHNTLMRQVKERIHDRDVLNLTWRFVKVFGEGVSLGLGSQVSQVLAVFYPNKLDHVIKEKLRIKFYGRYMDDLYLIHKSKEYLEECLAEIREVCKSLGMTINEKKTRIFPLREGLLFLKGKYHLQDNGKIMKKATKESAKRMRRKLKSFRKLINAGKMGYNDLRIAYQSWRGNYMRRFHAYETVKKMDQLYDELFINEHRNT